MEKRLVIILVTGMIMASLVGCGTKTEATSQAVESSDVEHNDSASEEIVQTEVIVEDANVSDSTAEEVTNNVADDVVYEEHEYFYVRNKLDLTDATPMNMNDLEVEGKTYTLNESVNIYATSKGALKGYTKPNIEVYVNSYNEDWYCLYFENEASPNDYVLVKAEDFIVASGIEVKEKILITLKDVKDCFAAEIEKVGFYDFSKFEMLDSVSSDMESVEIYVPMYLSDEDSLKLNLWISEALGKYKFTNYSKFYIEEIENTFDDEYLWLRIYYKEKQEFAQ